MERPFWPTQHQAHRLIAHSKSEHTLHPASRMSPQKYPLARLFPLYLHLFFFPFEISVSPFSRVPCFSPEATKSHFPLSVYFWSLQGLQSIKFLAFFVLGIGKGQSRFPGVGRKNIWLAFPSLFCEIYQTDQHKTSKQANREESICPMKVNFGPKPYSLSLSLFLLWALS